MTETLTPPRRWRPVTTEPVLVKGGLIAFCLAVLSVLLFAPLIAVFHEAFARGWAFALASLGDRDAQAAIRLTLTVVAIILPLNAVFGIAAAWVITKFD